LTKGASETPPAIDYFLLMLLSIRTSVPCFRLRATGEILETARGKADRAGSQASLHEIEAAVL
jgi:hypothetical protein